MSHDVFVSYSHSDKAVADAACATLEREGLRCWIAPRDINPGAEWGGAIIEAINHCRVMVLIFSASANDSPQIRREVERAVNKEVPVLPFRIQDVQPTQSLEYFIGTLHWLDAMTPPMEAHLQHLAQTIKALMKVPSLSSDGDDTARRSVPPPVTMPAAPRVNLPAWILAGCAGDRARAGRMETVHPRRAGHSRAAADRYAGACRHRTAPPERRWLEVERYI